MSPYYSQDEITATATTLAGVPVNVYGWLGFNWHCTGCDAGEAPFGGMDKSRACRAAQSHAARCRLTKLR